MITEPNINTVKALLEAALLVTIFNLLSKIDLKKCPKRIVAAVTNNTSTVSKKCTSQFQILSNLHEKRRMRLVVESLDEIQKSFP